MKWNNFKNYKCPKCNNYLKDIGVGTHECTKCDFSISKEKFDTIISKMNAKKGTSNTPVDNMEALNDL